MKIPWIFINRKIMSRQIKLIDKAWLLSQVSILYVIKGPKSEWEPFFLVIKRKITLDFVSV